ncbi:unnamed protein product [Leptidea sinapis]|uniref:Lipase domain-containing protein n=1 Tax=Leptidea sinapis TaxID=189913 RepID=A0A5E4QEJ4_9NEOP|nr:unnamed protein product [Leptidea sinapis]
MVKDFLEQHVTIIAKLLHWRALEKGMLSLVERKRRQEDNRTRRLSGKTTILNKLKIYFKLLKCFVNNIFIINIQIIDFDIKSPAFLFLSATAKPRISEDNDDRIANNMDSMWVDDDNIYRNVWMSDDVVPSDMELEEPIDIEFLNSKNGANNAYWLFTRENPTHPQLIINGDVSTIRNSNYVANRPLKVVVHGWSGSVNSVLNTRITAAFLATTDVNVIVVDWQELAAANYVTAVAGVPSVGQHLGEFVNWLIENGGGVWDNVHLVGFSLGAHIVLIQRAHCGMPS